MAYKFVKLNRSFTVTKSLDEAGIFEGYASVFNDEDYVGDIVERGAFTKGLQKLVTEKRSLKMLFNHNPDTPIGVFKEADEDANGLYVRGKLTLGVQKADEVRLLMIDGAVDAMSIGGYVIKDEFNNKTLVRKLKEVQLREISPVVFPALDSARITSVKSLPDDASVGDVERYLREAGLSRSEAKHVISVIKGAPLQREADQKQALIDALHQTIKSLKE